MKFSKQCIDFMSASSLCNESSTVYICDRRYCYMKTKLETVTLYRPGEAIITKELREYFDKVENYCNEKNIHIDISDMDTDRESNCLMIHKIYDNLFLVSTNHFFEFIDGNINYANTTVEFLRQLIKPEDVKR